jgi:hypothetical protein
MLLAGSFLVAIASNFSHAAVTSVVSLSLNNVDALLIPAPAAVTPEALTTNPANQHLSAFVFEERQNVTLASNLNVDVADDLTYIPSAFAHPLAMPPGGVIPAGTQVNSVYVHFDTPLATFGVADFVVHLNENILGVIFTDDLLDASDLILGAGGTIYPTNLDLRGTIFDPLEAIGSENVFIGVPGDGLGPSRDIIFRMEVEAVLDGARIITQPIPEPMSTHLVVIALSAIAMRRELRPSHRA